MARCWSDGPMSERLAVPSEEPTEVTFKSTQKSNKRH